LYKLQLNCVLTIELIEAVDRILFYPNASKTDDEINVKMALVSKKKLLKVMVEPFSRDWGVEKIHGGY